MPLTLRVDGPRWREHLRRTYSDSPGLVPVAKGNGYGLGVGRLARRADWLGCDLVAVGTYREVAEVVTRFSGDILVLEPWRPFLEVPYGPRIVHTVGRLEDLVALAERTDRPRVVLEALTSMRRHGFAAADLRVAASHPATRGVRVEGHALHLPFTVGQLDEVESWLAAAPAATWFVSHLSADELSTVAAQHPQTSFRPRVGTRLWLGDRAALSAQATVLDVHTLRRGERTGYRQRRAPGSGHVLIVSGGTAHGIALEAPATAASMRQRAVSLARGGLEAAGLSLSPFVVAGKRRWFVEPPHMQVSMLYLPADVPLPAVGAEVDVGVRYTTTTFDAVHIS